MHEFTVIEKILNEKWLNKDDGTGVFRMAENATDQKSRQEVEISGKRSCVTAMALYEFNVDGKDSNTLLPFFNKEHSDERTAPKGLNSFCDYILLLEKENVTVVFLIELKRGIADGAEVQLNASRCFMDYIIRTAVRIKQFNQFEEFDENAVIFRRVIIRESHSNKQITKRCDISYDKLDDVQTCWCKNQFYPLYYC